MQRSDNQRVRLSSNILLSVAARGLLWVPALSSPFVASANEAWQKRLDPASVFSSQLSGFTESGPKFSRCMLLFFFCAMCADEVHKPCSDTRPPTLME